MARNGCLAGAFIGGCLAAALCTPIAVAEPVAEFVPIRLEELPTIFDITVDRSDASSLMLATRSGTKGFQTRAFRCRRC